MEPDFKEVCKKFPRIIKMIFEHPMIDKFTLQNLLSESNSSEAIDKLESVGVLTKVYDIPISRNAVYRLGPNYDDARRYVNSLKD